MNNNHQIRVYLKKAQCLLDVLFDTSQGITHAIKNKETIWGVTVHFMDQDYDTGDIIEMRPFDLHEPPNSIEELGPITHYFLFNLFKDTIKNIYNGEITSYKQMN